MDDALKGYAEFESSLEFEITSLMGSPGLLWVGTSSGIILNYPILLNQDSGPKIIMKPNVSMHGCNGSSKFFSILPFGSVALKSGYNSNFDLQLNHEETVSKHADSNPTASDAPSTKTPPQDSLYLPPLPESSVPSTFKEDGQISSSVTLQIQGITEPRTDEDEKCIPSAGNVFRTTHISNNPFVLQEKSNNTLMENQSEKGIEKLEKSPKVVVNPPIVTSRHENRAQPSTRNISSFVTNRFPEERTEPSKRTVDSDYGSTKPVDVNNLPSTSGQNCLNRLLRVPSGELKRQSSVRKSRTRSTRRSVSSRPISRSDSWKIQSTNTYLVISGGDGYKDWKNRQPIQYRNDEAVLLFWTVKV
ncbi:hypothetical protein CHS0354_026062 [Potamilus streckersoni]|uniref:Uncharacterized protein n=1 Tax=Potamilus streckersoni TaxID=2493646 RepID=A0AAE0SG35_9BIVA|nr:hypothetical protein CHS0354_026062 [Potamilus streckersoni]